MLDIAAGGARLGGLAAGISSGRLMMAGLPPVQASVVGISDGNAHLKFVFGSEAERTEVANAVEALVERKAA